MQRFPTPVPASCSCGDIQVRVHGALTRFVCHCSICQRVNRGAFGDPVVMFRWQVEVLTPEALEWSRNRWTAINVNRGSCRSCGDVVVEHIAASPLSIVVAPAWTEPDRLPPVQGHVFYESRAADVDDELPRHSHYWPSQLAMTAWIAKGLFR